jgi:hypothetical protein
MPKQDQIRIRTFQSQRVQGVWVVGLSEESQHKSCNSLHIIVDFSSMENVFKKIP